MNTVLILSGGMDSATLAYHLIEKDHTIYAVTFNYSQRHKKEIDSAIKIAKHLNISHTILDISNIGMLLKGSSLTDDIPTPHGHYTAENMKLTVVPNRNAIMLSIAYGIAVSLKYDMVAIGVHAGDHHIYPDCRENFIHAIEHSLQIGNESNITIYAPYLTYDKTDIAEEGAKLSVPYQDTWTCYEGGENHCGLCGSCNERKEAFKLANVKDVTEYKCT